MNRLERQMLDILKRGREAYGFVAVKAEFEAEGTRADEFLRLLEIARKAGVGVGLKIGGCEAVRDLIESKQYGAEYIIAPMVETPYALSKFVDAKNKIYSKDEQQDTEFLFNLETITGFNNISGLAAVAQQQAARTGFVFGRVDFALSDGNSRDSINSDKITEYVLKVAAVAKQTDLPLVVGGSISTDAIDALQRIRSVYLTRFETRKIIFDADRALGASDIQQGMLNAVHFELLWLTNKREYYSALGGEDDKRIRMLEDRLKTVTRSAD